MSNNMIVLFLGIINSCVLHIARSLQRQGIHTFDNLLHHLHGSTDKIENRKNRLYIAGLILSNATVVLVIFASKYGTISYFTAMYGIGMVPMLIYTHFVMHEKSESHHWLGVTAIISGCILMAFSAHSSQAIVISQISPLLLIIVLCVIVIAVVILITLGKRAQNPFFDASAAGLSAGLVASLDPLLKSIGQNYGNSEHLLPGNFWGWIFFLLSFVATTSALLITQYTYRRRIKASQFIPYYNAAYITTPVIFQTILHEDYQPGIYDISGILVIICGIIIFSVKDLKTVKSVL